MSRLFKTKFSQHLIPFMVLLIGGSFGLREFTQLRYTYKNPSGHTFHEEMRKSGINLRDPSEVSLEKEYEKLKAVDIDNWENVRIPRPWDETADTK